MTTPSFQWWSKNGLNKCSYINESTTPMSRPPRPQMISPSPTCTTRGTTPRTTSLAPTVTSRSSRTGGNLEGYQQQVQGGVSGPLVVTVWWPAGTSPRMSPEPTIAKSEVEGYATFASLILQFSLKPSEDSARAFRQEPKRIEEQVVKSQRKIQSLWVVLWSLIICWLVMMTVSHADALRGRECKYKAEDLM